MRVAIGVRERGHIGYNKFWKSLITLDVPKPYHFIAQGGYSVEAASRAVFKQFMATDATHLLMLDDDAILHPATLTRLLSRYVPVVSGLTFTRAYPPMPTIYRGRTGVDEHGYPTWHIRSDDVLEWLDKPELHDEINAHQADDAHVLSYDGPDALVGTDNIGFHCVLIARDVIERVGEPYCKADEMGVREDFDFSRRVREAGYSMYVDRSVFVGHISHASIRPIDFWCYQQVMVKDSEKEIHGEEK